MSDTSGHTLPDWTLRALREPVESRPESRDRIMSRVLQLPAPRQHAAPMRPSRWIRRGLLAPVGGLMTTVVMASFMLLRLGVGAGGLTNLETVTRVLGDSVVPATVPSNALSLLSPDTLRILDTLRIVEFVIRGTSAHAVRAASVLGDFNEWRRGATPLVAAGSGEWRTRVLVPRDVLSVAYLVNNTRLVPVTIGSLPRVQQ